MINEKFINVFNRFRQECIWARQCFNTYRTLFESDQKTLDLLHKKAPSFFHDINEILVDHLILQMCKLTDPPKTGKNENLTAQFINKELQTLSLSSPEIEDLCKSLLRHRATIIDFRNQYVSHLDKDASIEYRAFNLGEPEDAPNFFEALQKFCDAVGNVLGVGPLDFRASPGTGDAIDLIRILRRT